jgi:hypothetical protein
MIKLRRLSETMFAAALLLCAFPKVAGSEEKPDPSPEAIESKIQSLRDDFHGFEIDVGKRLHKIEVVIEKLLEAMSDSSSPPDAVEKTFLKHVHIAETEALSSPHCISNCATIQRKVTINRVVGFSSLRKDIRIGTEQFQ